MKKRTLLLTSAASLLTLASASFYLVAAQQAARPAAASKGKAVTKATAKTATSAASAPHKALVDRYCVGCHNSRTKTAGLALDTLSLANVGPDAEIWEKAARKLRAGMMPPPGAPQPDPAAALATVNYLEASLDQYGVTNPNPGIVALHRLNRAEYANAVEDILGVRVDASALLPTDDVSDGFDNIAAVLKVSPSFLDQYVSAARTITLQAVGTAPADGPQLVTVRGGVNGDPYSRTGVPLGLRPTLLVDQLFPFDGEYEFRYGAPPAAGGGRGAAGGRGGAAAPAPAPLGRAAAPATVDNTNVVTVDGVRVPLTGRVTLKAGLHRVGVSAPMRSTIESEAVLQSLVPGQGGAGGFGH